MRVLGNNLTYQSPSRGFCMDVGSAITILIGKWALRCRGPASRVLRCTGR